MTAVDWRPKVADVRQWMAQLGYDPDRPLVEAVAEYQLAAGLDDDGDPGPITGAALIADVARKTEDDLESFRGLLGFISGQESHQGHPYCPPVASSGVTLDPGFDLGQQTIRAMQRVYADLLTPQELLALSRAVGVRPPRARALARDPDIAAIRIARPDAAELLPRVVGPYWRAVQRECPVLLQPSVPSAVHTAVLSLAMNAGHGGLLRIAPAIRREDWLSLVRTLEGMHRTVPALARRRREEALLVRRALEQRAA